MLINKGADPRTISNTFNYWLWSRKEWNPRRVTLDVWAEYNAPEVPDEVLDKVWEMVWMGIF